MLVARDSLFENKVCRKIDGEWVPARPINYKYQTPFERLRDTWLVLIGKADALVWNCEPPTGKWKL